MHLKCFANNYDSNNEMHYKRLKSLNHVTNHISVLCKFCQNVDFENNFSIKVILSGLLLRNIVRILNKVISGVLSVSIWAYTFTQEKRWFKYIKFVTTDNDNIVHLKTFFHLLSKDILNNEILQ